MGRKSDLHADPYLYAMSRYERRVWGYGAIAVVLMIAALMVAPGEEQQAGMFGPMIVQMKVRFGYGFLIAAALSCTWSIWSLERRLYFGFWPERFY